MSPTSVSEKLRSIAQDKRKRHSHAFIFASFIIGLPFSAFGTYVIFQLQQIGFIIGHGVDSPICETSCIVPFGTGDLDLNAVILYLNAMGFGFSGFLIIFIAALGDYWRRKSVFLILTLIIYGALCIPGAWLDGFTKPVFDTLAALYVVYAVVTLMIAALLNIYIPHLMNTEPEMQQHSSPRTTEDNVESHPAETVNPDQSGRQKVGTWLSVFGIVANYAAGIIILVLGIILSATLPFDRQQAAGLIITTVAGFVVIVCAFPAYVGLPTLYAKGWPEGKRWWTIVFTSVVDLVGDLFRHWKTTILLLGYTIYVDTTFALISVINQLFTQIVRPSTLEFSLFSLTASLTSVAFALLWFFFHERIGISLRSWLIIGYSISLLVPFWGSIGISSSTNVGFKHRAEFYVGIVINNLAGAILNPVFRVVYSEYIPPKHELQWWGMQVIISCATTWVPYVVLAPFQQATNNLRYPLLCCLVMLLIPLGLEIWSLFAARKSEAESTRRQLSSETTMGETDQSDASREEIKPSTVVDTKPV